MKRNILRIAVIALILTFITVLITSIAVAYSVRNIDYDFDEELFRRARVDSTVYYYAYDTSGQLVEVYKGTNGSQREWTNFIDVGRYIKQGFIAMEDRNFYNHHGINYKRTLLAFLNRIFRFKSRFGASTITQQLIKNISGDNEFEISRKINEIFRAINLEKKHSKDDIFELYLNIIPMSGNIYGVGAASEIYFGKEPSDLNLSEAATLVGITNAPTKYNPYLHPDACVEKRNKVLYAMYDVGYINKEEYELALQEPLKLTNGSGGYGIASWFIETANEDIYSDLNRLYGISRGASRLFLNGARIILTMNPEIQNILDEHFSNTENLAPVHKDGLKYSMVVSDPYTGDLLGIVGNGGKKSGEKLFNYATTPIIPGSALKPIALYAPLIDEGLVSWSTTLQDAPHEYKMENGEQVPYPRNSPDIYEGAVDLNYALKKSKNTVAISLFNMMGSNRIFDHLRNDYGFDTLVDAIKSDDGHTISDLAASPLALGQLSRGISLRKITEAYNVFSGGGVIPKGRSYLTVLDSTGKLLLNNEQEIKRIYSEETAQIMNQMLSCVVMDGTARNIKLKELVDTAGKTGTSGGDRDRVFIGYTPYYTAGIWCGYDNSNIAVGNNTPSHLHIWDEVMHKIHDRLVFTGYDEAVRSFDTSRLIVAPYCAHSGMMPTQKCELDDDAEIREGYFAPNNAPADVCNYH